MLTDLVDCSASLQPLNVRVSLQEGLKRTLLEVISSCTLKNYWFNFNSNCLNTLFMLFLCAVLDYTKTYHGISADNDRYAFCKITLLNIIVTVISYSAHIVLFKY